jgi:hypothetical protein
MKSVNHLRRGWLVGLVTGVLSLSSLVGPAPRIARAENTNNTPFKADDSGSWGFGSHDCGALLPVVVDTTGTGTHLGHYKYTAQECADLEALTYDGVFTIKAADGATLFGTYAGTFDFDEAGNIVYQQTNTIVGGTDRLVAASGSFTVSGLADTNSFADEQVLLGSISLH